MDSNSQAKVIRAGFRILRSDDQPNIRIKYKGQDVRDWTTLEVFQSKAARDRRLKELLMNEQNITD